MGIAVLLEKLACLKAHEAPQTKNAAIMGADKYPVEVVGVVAREKILAIDRIHPYQLSIFVSRRQDNLFDPSFGLCS